MGREAVDLCGIAGLRLDDWQQFVLEGALGERADGRFSAFEVATVLSRQNGKSEIFVARMLAGLFLLGEELIIYSAHEFATAQEIQMRLEEIVQNTPELHKRVSPRGYRHSHGNEGISLRSGQRVNFRTRTKKGGRGFSADCVLFDEAMELPATSVGALLPTLSARENPQVWYGASAVDRMVHADGVVMARVRERGLSGDDPALAYFEWSVDAPLPELDDDELADRVGWAQANPALGIRISEDHVAREMQSMDRRTFAVERLGVGDWPRTDGLDDVVIGVKEWSALVDDASVLVDPVWFALDVSPDRSRAAIAACGRRPDGLAHVEVVDHRPGTGWVLARALELQSHSPLGWVCDGIGPVASLIQQMEEAGLSVRTVSTQEHAQACGLLFDAVKQSTLRHLGSGEVLSAVKGAKRRPLGDAWAWSRKNSGVDISPLVAVTLAHWAVVAVGSGASVYEDRGLLVFGM